tara:strand:+ start:1286 stop:1438 length:153 start_codon:yes stop_codon:yes gene_type:complete
LLEADSFDVMVFDVALKWERMQQSQQDGKVDTSMYSQEELQSIMKKVKGK